MTKSIFLFMVLFPWLAQAQADQKSQLKDKAQELFKSKQGQELIHQQLSAKCFNESWKYISKKQRNSEDIENMLSSAYASLWHWKQRKDCTPKNLSIAYWQLAKVHCLANKADTAKAFAEKCLSVSQKNKLKAFYIGYAYEALSQSALISKDSINAKNFLSQAQEQCKLIDNKENQKYLQADLEAIKSSLDKL